VILTLPCDVKHMRKALVAGATALSLLGVALVDGNVDAQEAINVVLGALGSVGVYAVRNKASDA